MCLTTHAHGSFHFSGPTRSTQMRSCCICSNKITQTRLMVVVLAAGNSCTFLAKGDLFISRSAFAPRSRASGSKLGPRASLSSSQYAAVHSPAETAAAAEPAVRAPPSNARNIQTGGRPAKRQSRFLLEAKTMNSLITDERLQVCDKFTSAECPDVVKVTQQD